MLYGEPVFFTLPPGTSFITDPGAANLLLQEYTLVTVIARISMVPVTYFREMFPIAKTAAGVSGEFLKPVNSTPAVL